MDVVKRNVEDVGGTVVITSDPGRGMTTTLKIPLTMAIMDGMEVSVGSSIFTIPIQNIRQSFKVNDSDLIHDASGGELFKCMGSFYPVIRMRDRYQLEGGCSQISDGILIWLESGELSYCLFVDELLGEQQVVVKPLPSYLSRFNIKQSGIAGCTILGMAISASSWISPTFTPPPDPFLLEEVCQLWHKTLYFCPQGWRRHLPPPLTPRRKNIFSFCPISSCLE